MLRFFITALCLLISASAFADGPGVIVKAGTLGAGLDIGWALNESFGTRLSINGYSTDDTFTESDIEYKADLDLATAGVLLDWHPFRGVFRLTAGAYANKNELSATAQATSGTFVINGVTYNASDVGSLSGLFEFDSVSPYVGFGFGRMWKSGFKITGDIGVLYQKPDVRLTVVCGVGLPAPTCAQLQSDVAAEQTQLSDELDDYRFYPVVAIGLGWVF